MTNSRLKKLTRLFRDHQVDAYLVTDDTNITYLTEFKASESWLLVTSRKCSYITDFRYVEEAKVGLKGIKVEQYTSSFFNKLFELVKAQKIKRLGIDDRHVTLAFFKQLKKHCPKGVKLVSMNQCVESIRMIKEPKEIRLTKKALEIHSIALGFLKRIVKPGKSEREIFRQLERWVKDREVGFSFDPIIAVGPNAALPHAPITGRKVKQNEVVLIDMGIDYRGYKSDLTRMFFLGKIPARVREVTEIVGDAQKEAIAKIKPGVPVAEVDATARNYLKKYKLAKYFGHSLGHGVGLDIHESPRISEKDPTILQKDMIITIEPGVYLPGEFGVRIEDMILVTKNGFENLSDHYH